MVRVETISYYLSGLSFVSFLIVTISHDLFIYILRNDSPIKYLLAVPERFSQQIILIYLMILTKKTSQPLPKLMYGHNKFSWFYIPNRSNKNSFISSEERISITSPLRASILTVIAFGITVFSPISYTSLARSPTK